MISEKPPSSITITIKGNSFHFYRDTNFWFETTIALPTGTNPQELHATITGSAASQASSIGQVVFAIVKIEDGTMTLATEGGGGEAPKSFEEVKGGGATTFKLRKVQPRKENAGLPSSP